MQNKRFFAVVIVVGVLALGALDVGAQTSGSGGGTLTFGRNTPEVVELGGGRSMLRTSNSGAYVADDPESPLHLATQDCRGTVVLSASGDPVGSHGYCDCVDSDGDMFWISYSNDLDTGSWEILEGTGKFDGMQGAGSVEFLLNLPDGRLVLAWDGSWTMQ